MRFKKQIVRDQNRDSYLLTFPSDLEPEQITAWLRAVVETLYRRTSAFNRETLVFETWANSREIFHRLLVSKDIADHITQQLRTHGRGIAVLEDDSRPNIDWTTGIELGMSNPTRQLQIVSHADVSASILGSIQTLHEGEDALIQWVVGAAMATEKTKRDPRSAEFSVLRSLAGYSAALSDELQDRYAKLEEPNTVAVCRVVVRAEPARASDLVLRIQSAIASTNASSNHWKQIPSNNLIAEVNEAATTSHPQAQLNLTELSALVGWKIGGPHVAGLTAGTSRHLPATESIPREGRVIGTSNFPHAARPIAIGRVESLTHLHILGPTGAGKTTLMANLMAQDMNEGYGVVMLEGKGDLYKATIKLIPTNRLDDVIILDVNEQDSPVGFNILEQGNPSVVIDQLTDLFQSLYADGGRGVWMRELMYHGLHTLAERSGMTFVDLAALVSPRTTREITWADEMRKAVKNPEVREFWQDRWNTLDKKAQETYSAPLHNRIWQLSTRPELRNIIGQSKSSFFMDDVIRDNKILLINLSGVPKEAASIAGTLIMNAIWSSVQRVKAEKNSYLYIDEFQDFIRLPVGAEDMLAKSRGFGLALTLAHQHLNQLTDDIKSAVMANARSKIVFGLEDPDDARAMQRAIGGDTFSQQDFQSLEPHEAVAKVITAKGSSLITISTPPPLAPTGNDQAALKRSRELYGRPVAEVQQAIEARRNNEPKKTSKRPAIGYSKMKEWGK
ncbi:type IV secretion system DNA-binding domain-containing protein [Cryobacterium sp. GrIS_2_6]|uniref:type IV secretory system conjugative DNA transfer family protein n=1 Tax=Cryobacterium sp. GrIS_2_6 TaxID=3162785 RepID=UPI002E0A4B87|nr:energy-coupling factor transporter ATP-binding protein EcfA2 [Cryobacterium psychrotolerans]